MSNFSIDNLLAPVRGLSYPGHFAAGPNFGPSMAAAAAASAAAAAQFMFATSSSQATADLLAAYQWQSTSDPLRVQYFMPGFGSPGMCLPPGAAGFFAPHHLMTPFGNGKRKRRHRTIFNDEQLAILEKTFNSTQYPDINMREKLAQECDLKEERVEVWFKNRRAKERKSAKDTSSNGSSHNSSTHSKSNADSSDCDVSDSESASGDSPAKRRKSNDGGHVSPDENRRIPPPKSVKPEP
ncbi:hypothetical protein L596_009203 [Steinernema carpocapsae]|uniref:Homeobox domain-containing protein n=1 Tax=Steinernema carpocapsae TaxID=34508 RepID=A0A4U5PEV4_STECR|nr:hypothetical protein L596_009203 [Steinernema carpocapsae]